MSFWNDLSAPIIGLSPMDGVSDYPFRHIQKKYGRPAVVYTEFTSVEGVCHGADRLLKDFLFDETQRPVVAQIYGTTPQFFYETAILLCELGFDGIDINMGCPAKNVAHSGAGAALIQTPDLAVSIIQAVQQAIIDWQNGKSPTDCEHITPVIAAEVAKRHEALPPQFQEKRHIPVSVKTRIGYSQEVVESWIPTLLSQNLAAIALHGRTLKQQYGGEANWEVIAKAAAMVKQTSTKILGNGDVSTYQDALQKIAAANLDGVLIGRASMGNPYVFLPQPAETSVFKIAVEHAQLYENTFSHEERYNFLPMRKHLGWYVKNVENASQIRVELYQTNSAAEAHAVFQSHQLLEQ